MPEINCYLPIKLCITGRPTDQQLDELSQSMVRALSARIAFAQRTIAEAHGDAVRTGSVEIVREGYDPAREDPELGSYRVPSYQGGGHPTTVPLRRRAPQNRRPWIIRNAVNFQVSVGDYLRYIAALSREQNFGRDLYYDLLDELRWVSVWLVQVNRPFLLSEIHPILYQRAAELSRIRDHQLLAYGEAFVETNRQELIAIDESGIVAREIPSMLGNARLIEPAGNDLRLLSGARVLFTTMILPKIELGDLITLEAEILRPVDMRDLTFLVPADNFKQEFGISWETYLEEFGETLVMLRLQPFTVRRQVNIVTLRVLIAGLVRQRLSRELTAPGTISLSLLGILNDSTLSRLPLSVRSDAAASTNDVTRAVSDAQVEGQWDVNWKGSYFAAVVNCSEDNIGAALYHPEARKLVPELLDRLEGDPEGYHWALELLKFLQQKFGRQPPETRPRGGTVFEWVLIELENRGQLRMLFEKAYDSGDIDLQQHLVRLSLATRFANDALVRRLQRQLISDVLARHRNIYREQPQEIWLDRDPNKRVGVNGVFGVIDDTYIFKREAKRLKSDRADAFAKALTERRQDLIRQILQGDDTTEYNEGEFLRAAVDKAVEDIKLTDDDFETVKVQRSMRLLRVESKMQAGLLRYYVTFEFVDKVEDGDWTRVSQPVLEVEGEFEARLIYWALGRSGEFYEGVLKAMTVAGVVIAVVVFVAFAWEAGLIAALVKAAGGMKALLTAVLISELIYVARVVFGDAELTPGGFLMAAVDGYLMAVGFNLGGFAGRWVGWTIGRATLTSWAARKLAVGIVGGAASEALMTFCHDLVRVVTGRGDWSDVGTYLRNMGVGALFGTLFEFAAPALKAIAGPAVQSIKQFAERARLAGFSGGRWIALIKEAQGNLESKLFGIVGEVNARGIVRVMGERAIEVAEYLSGQYRLDLFKQVLELTPGAMSQTAVEGLEKLLTASRADLTNEAAMALLNRASATQVRPFLEALNNLERPMIGVLARSGQLEALANAPRLAGLIRSDPALADLIRRASTSADGGAARIRNILATAEGLPVVPESIERGNVFAARETASGTKEPIIWEIEGQPDLLTKVTGSARDLVEARGMLELQAMGIETVYAGTRQVNGQTNIILKRIDGVGSKDIIGGARNQLRVPKNVEVVTQRTIDDLDRIYRTLEANGTNVGDFQFIVRRSDGAVIMNDPASVTFGAPNDRTRFIIKRFKTIWKAKQSGGSP